MQQISYIKIDEKTCIFSMIKNWGLEFSSYLQDEKSDKLNSKEF